MRLLQVIKKGKYHDADNPTCAACDDGPPENRPHHSRCRSTGVVHCEKVADATQPGNEVRFYRCACGRSIRLN